MDVIAVVLIGFVVMEAAQVFLLNQAVRTIKLKVEAVIPSGPDGRTPNGGELLAMSAIEFMGLLNEKTERGERAREVVGGFFRTAAATAADEVRGRFMSAGDGGPGLSAVLPKKYQWVGVLADAVGPQLADAAKRRAEASKTAPAAQGGKSGW